MYNQSLDVFLAVADCKSFTKASEELFLSHTAVIKKINALEKEYRVRLLNRSNHGVSLTKAGQLLYERGLEIRRFSDDTKRKLLELQNEKMLTVQIGASVFYPCHRFIDLWETADFDAENYKIEVVPIAKDEQRFEGLQNNYDMIIGPYNSQASGQRLNFFQMGTYQFCIAVPRKHPLAKKSEIKFTDLSGETIMIMDKGHSEINDAIREVLEQSYPNVRIKDISPSYGIQMFNQCAEEGILLLSLECWDRVHPALVHVPLTESYKLPYGILLGENYKEELGQLIRKLIPNID